MRQLALLFTLIALYAHGETLKPVQKNGGLTVGLQGIALKKDELDKEFKSGIATPILIRMNLKTGETVISHRTAVLRVIYDLWDEVFVVEYASTESKSRKSIKELAKVYSFIEELPLPALALMSELTPKTTYVIEVSLLGSPIDKAKFETMRKWVAEHAVTAPSESGESVVQGGSSGTRLNSLFRGLLNKNLDVDGVAGRWEVNAKTKPFSSSEISDETKR